MLKVPTHGHAYIHSGEIIARQLKVMQVSVTCVINRGYADIVTEWQHHKPNE